MPTHPVTKDVTDPAFPHGQERGYFRGCKSECCVRAHSREAKRRALLSMRGVTARVDAGPIREHLAHLVSLDSTFHLTAIATASGVLHKTVWDISRGNTEMVSQRNAARLLAVTPEQIRAATWRVPADKARAQVRGMMAQGWPGTWICERLGYTNPKSRQPVFMYAKTNHLTRDLADRVDALAAEVGGSIGPSHITATRSKRRGWWPLAALDEDGTLNLRGLPGHPWHEADQDAGRLIDAAIESTRIESSLTIAAERYGLDRERLRHVTVRLRESGPDYARTIRDIERALEEPDADVVLIGLRCGALSINSVSGVPGDHPAAEQYRQERRALRASKAS